jgi:O-antigen/teichoic acid export membrane protein
MPKPDVPTPPASTPPSLRGRVTAWLQQARQQDLSVLVYFAARVVSAIAGFFSTKVQVGLLSKPEYALWGTLAAVSAMVVPVVTLSVPAAMMRIYFDYGAQDTAKQVRLVSTTLLLLLASAAALFGYVAIAGALGLHDRAMLVYLAGVTTSTSLLGFFTYLNRVRNDYGLFFASQVSERLALMTLLLAGSAWWGSARADWPMGDRLLTAVALMAVAQWGIAAVNLAIYLRRGALNFRVPLLPTVDIGDMVRFSAPLSATYFLGWLLNSSDIYLLHRLGTPSDTADYVFALGIVTLVSLVSSAALTDWPRFYYEKMRDGAGQPDGAPQRDEPIARRANQYLWAHAGTIVVTQLVGRLAYWLYGADQYLRGLDYLGLLLLGNYFFLMGNLLSAGLGYAKKTHLTVVAFAVPGALNFGLNLLLIPRWGAHAAALTTAVAFALFAALCYALARPHYRFVGAARFWAPTVAAGAASALRLVWPW